MGILGNYVGCLTSVLVVYCLALLTEQVNCRIENRDVTPADNTVRLVGGSGDHEGRVEIYHDGQWGTVCNDLWDQLDGVVVCRQIGYPGVDHITDAGAEFDVASSGPIWMDNVQCNGTENTLADCAHNGWETHNCGHHEDVGVVCSLEAINEGEVRLIGGSSPREGRLEIFHEFQWGSVCMSSFTMTTAAVVCKQLGFSYAVRFLADPEIYGLGFSVAPIWLDGGGITCQGNELTLADCSHAGWQNTTCFSHRNDVDIICSATSASEDITLADRVRLVNGTGDHEGRVEVFHAGEWGTICDDDWDISDGHVVCRQLGFPSVSTIIHGNQWSGLNFGGTGNGTIWLDSVGCEFSSPSLYECTHSSWGQHNCNHNEDAGVVCNTEGSSVAEGSLRLEGGNSASGLDGRLEVYHDGIWGTVCDDAFDIIDARVACKQLGYRTAVKFFPFTRFGFGFGFGLRGGSNNGPIWLDNLACVGNESSLSDCGHSGWGINNCAHSEDIAIMCANDTGAEDYKLQLANGPTPMEGRLEIYYAGQWGTVCDDSFGVSDGRVACRQMGFTDVNRIITGGAYGEAYGDVLLDDLRCDGSEQRLIDCSHSGIGISNCGHSEDVGVECTNGTQGGTFVPDGTLRLVGGSTPLEGRLEVSHNNIWGTVCDDYFEETEGRVACIQLGYIDVEQIVLYNEYGIADGTIWLDDVNCQGHESKLTECTNNGWGVENCGHAEDVSLICTNTTAVDPSGPPEGTLRLEDGPTDMEGRLEIYYGGLWGTVCDDYFDATDADVACWQLGFANGKRVVTEDIYGYAGGPIWLDNVECSGNETALSDCSHAGWSVNNCGHGEDVGLVCSDGTSTTPLPVDENSLRLVDGQLPRSGRLEIYHSGLWGTICDDYFDTSDARVACRQLGYMDAAGIITDIAAGSGTIWLDDLQCNGNEESLSQCSHGGWALSNCEHNEDVGVTCSNVNSSSVPDGSLRLADGPNSLEGRLEIFHNNQWGTICDDGFQDVDGEVACRQLGYIGLQSVVYSISYTTDQGPVWLDDLDCQGTESSLTECSHPGWAIVNCGHSEDIGLICHDSTAAPDVTVRLVAGPTLSEGRLEVFHNGVWGTVCDDYFDTTDARVVCRQLGYDSALGIVTDDIYGIGSGRIWMDDVACNGNEQRLEDCTHNGWGTNNCGHTEDIGIRCSTSPDPTTDDGNLRLASSFPVSPYEGRLEIYHNGEWGTVCDDLFGENDGEVACRQMGFAGLSSIVTDGSYGLGTGSIWLDNVECNGVEERLTECDHVGWGGSNCGHSEDVAVVCTGSVVGTCPQDWQANGDYCYYVDNQALYSYAEARNACRLKRANLTSIHSREEQVFHDGLARSANTYLWIGLHDKVTEGNWKWEDNSQYDFTNWALGQPDDWNGAEDCGHMRTGSESGLWNDHSCTSRNGFVCKIRRGTSVPTTLAPSVPENSIRLVDGPTAQEGRLEIFHSGQWGTVCDDYFSISDATVACRQLGYETANRIVTDDIYGIGTGQIWLDDVDCTGSETALSSCNHNGWGVENCGHTEDIGIACADISSDVNYLGCFRDREDRSLDNYLFIRGDMTLERCYEHCRSHQSQKYAALQYSTECRCGGPFDDYAVHGSASESDCNADCGGNSQQSCGGTWRNSVYSLSTSENALRLVDGSNPREGRLEIYHNGTWGTICDDYFDTTDASVACRQMGFGNATLTTTSQYGSGTGPIWLDDLQCIGNENSLHQCPHGGWGNNNCGHGEDVGIVCQTRTAPPVDITVRLVGGSNKYEGRIEVYHGGEWGTVCDDYFTVDDGHVVCRQLGFGEATRIVTDDSFGAGIGTIWLDDVDCSGTEPTLESCRSGGWGVNNCGHLEDVGIVCSGGQGNAECYTDALGQDYRGFVNITGAGNTCQKWSSQLPHNHVRTEEQYPEKGLGDHNYCRNPDSEPGGPWCYTTDPDIRWQYCSVGQPSENCDAGGSTSENTLRLVSSTGSSLQGRLEIFHDGRWGTVCDDDFDLTDGNVACRQLGFTAAVRIEDPVEIVTNVDILMDNVRCTGTEELLADCPFAGWGVENCGHTEDVVLVCSDSTENVPENTVRLADGSGDFEGRVEIYHAGSWGTVCDDDWDLENGRVVCRQLGFATAQSITLGASFGQGSGPIFMDQVSCTGEESSLAACSHSGWSVHNCGHGEDAGVVCSQVTPTGTEGFIRLVGGSTPLEGRLEVFHNNEWGSVCDDGFEQRDARVACRQLGYSRGSVETGITGTGPIWLDDLNCVGQETVLTDCVHNGWGVHNCNHGEDVAIRCSPATAENPDEGAVRLVGGSKSREGRVEINHDHSWGTVCDDSWGIDDGNVVCRQLGFPGVDTVHVGAHFGAGSGEIWLDNVACSGSEERLVDCSHGGWASHNCAHTEDAGVTCLKGNLPVVSNCPSDRNILVKAGSPGTAVHWTEPSAVDRDGNPVPILFKTHTSGSLFYVGSTIVTYIFLDSSNGVSKCTFTVMGQLLDTTPPHISNCPADQTITVELGEQGDGFSWNEPYATDATGNVTLVSQSHRPGFVFQSGATTVAYKFADSFGNQASCNFVVTVNEVDTKPPEISNCPADMSILLDGDSSGKSVTWNSPIVADLSGDPYLLMQSHLSGTMFPPGTTIVTYVYSDSSHNLAKCSFQVTVASGAVVLDVSLTMEREFHDNLNDPNSAEYKALENTITATMDDIFADSAVANVYSMTEIAQFSRGSIEADCKVHLSADKKSTAGAQPLSLSMQPPQNADLQSSILLILQTATQPNGPLAELGVQPGSITVIMQTPSSSIATIASCPNTIQMSAKPDGSDVIVSWVEPIATDSVGVVPLVSKTHSPGSTFEVGSTRVKYTFGRSSIDTVSCIFTVEVNKGGTDTLVVKNCPSDIFVNNVKDGKGASVTWAEPWATYMSQNATIISQTHKSGALFADGKTKVSYVFAASNGFETSCDFAVNVNTDGNKSTQTGGGAGHSGLSVAGLVIAIMVAIILLLVLVALFVLYKRRRSSGYSMEMQGTSSFDGPPSPLGTSEYKSLF